MAVALVIAVACAVARASVIEAALAVAVAAFAAACDGVDASDVFAWLTAAGVIVTVAVLQDSYRLAFRDELAGLPGRRVLNERLMGLEGNYSIAMLDVDHFKAFNDAWGRSTATRCSNWLRHGFGAWVVGERRSDIGGEKITIVLPGKRLLKVLCRASRRCART